MSETKSKSKSRGSRRRSRTPSAVARRIEGAIKSVIGQGLSLDAHRRAQKDAIKAIHKRLFATTHPKETWTKTDSKVGRDVFVAAIQEELRVQKIDFASSSDSDRRKVELFPLLQTNGEASHILDTEFFHSEVSDADETVTWRDFKDKVFDSYLSGLEKLARVAKELLTLRRIGNRLSVKRKAGTCAGAGYDDLKSELKAEGIDISPNPSPDGEAKSPVAKLVALLATEEVKDDVEELLSKVGVEEDEAAYELQVARIEAEKKQTPIVDSLKKRFEAVTTLKEAETKIVVEAVPVPTKAERHANVSSDPVELESLPGFPSALQSVTGDMPESVRRIIKVIHKQFKASGASDIGSLLSHATAVFDAEIQDNKTARDVLSAETARKKAAIAKEKPGSLQKLLRAKHASAQLAGVVESTKVVDSDQDAKIAELDKALSELQFHSVSVRQLIREHIKQVLRTKRKVEERAISEKHKLSMASWNKGLPAIVRDAENVMGKAAFDAQQKSVLAAKPFVASGLPDNKGAVKFNLSHEIPLLSRGKGYIAALALLKQWHEDSGVHGVQLDVATFAEALKSYCPNANVVDALFVLKVWGISSVDEMPPKDTTPAKVKSLLAAAAAQRCIDGFAQIKSQTELEAAMQEHGPLLWTLPDSSATDEWHTVLIVGFDKSKKRVLVKLCSPLGDDPRDVVQAPYDALFGKDRHVLVVFQGGRDGSESFA